MLAVVDSQQIKSYAAVGLLGLSASVAWSYWEHVTSTVAVGPGQQFTSIQAAVSANPAGTSFDILAGTYNESISPKNGDVFDGAGVGQTILNGQNTLADGFWGPTAGVGNPNGAQNVTINGMTIENFTDMGIREGSVENIGWVTTNNEIAFNGGQGINFGNGDIFENNIVHDNQLNGLHEVWSQILTINNNVIYNNNLSHSDPWTATSDTGGTKFDGGGSFTITNNKIYGNYGPALWFDNEVHTVTISRNEISNTTNGPGIDVEINLPQGSNAGPDFLIHDNYIHDNAGAGVLLLNSGNVETYNNAFANNRLAAYVIGDEGNRGPASNGLPYLNENDGFHNNRVATTTLAVNNYDSGFNAWKAQNNKFSADTYYLSGGASAFGDNGSHLTVAQWRAEGCDGNSTFNSNGGILPNGVGSTSDYRPQGSHTRTTGSSCTGTTSC
jgi:Right handed beta helix region